MVGILPCLKAGSRRQIPNLQTSFLPSFTSVCNRVPYSDQSSNEMDSLRDNESSLAKPDAVWQRQVLIAPGQDAAKVLAKLEPLLVGRGEAGRRWYLCLGGKGIRRSFYFKTFNKTWVYSNRDPQGVTVGAYKQRIGCKPLLESAKKRVIIRNGGM